MSRSTDPPPAPPRTFHVENLGCSKNQVDAEVMIAALERAGWTLAAGPADASLIIVNTCGFISAAKKESIETTLALRAQHPGKRLVMAGCLSERYGAQLSEELPEVDGFLGARDPSAIVEVADPGAAAGPGAAAPGTAPAGGEPARPYERRHLLSFPGSAYVKVAEGCDNRCTYCAIPLIRGRLTSRARAGILDEIRGLRDRGVREMILIAQDLGSWGWDTGEGDLPGLLDGIAGIDGDFWVRLLYVHPDHFPRSILDLPRRDPRFLPYFDVPFQHASPAILRGMGRRADPARNLDLVAEIRARAPGAVLRTTFLVGFPGETDEDFRQLLSFQEAARPDWMGVFAYSREEDTPAARLKARVTKPMAERRKAELEARQVPLTEAALDARVGTVVDVLVEEQVDGEDLSLGRAWMQAPDVDGLVVLRGTHPAGARVRARVVKRSGVDLEADPGDA